MERPIPGYITLILGKQNPLNNSPRKKTDEQKQCFGIKPAKTPNCFLFKSVLLEVPKISFFSPFRDTGNNCLNVKTP